MFDIITGYGSLKNKNVKLATQIDLNISYNHCKFSENGFKIKLSSFDNLAC